MDDHVSEPLRKRNLEVYLHKRDYLAHASMDVVKLKPWQFLGAKLINLVVSCGPLLPRILHWINYEILWLLSELNILLEVAKIADFRHLCSIIFTLLLVTRSYRIYIFKHISGFFTLFYLI